MAMIAEVAVGPTTIVPVELREARAFVATHHRHSEPPVGHRFSIGLRLGEELVGVVIAGRPVARMVDDGLTLELTRCTTIGTRNACSRLYSAACRAAFAMGYRLVITYTLAEEDGASLRASGFREDGAVSPTGVPWRYRSGEHSKPRVQDRPTLFDPPRRPTGPKQRWYREAS